MSFFGDETIPTTPAAPALTRAPVAGFAPRKIEVEPLKRERGAGDEAVHTFTLRCRVEASNEFVAFCIAEKLTYREGMDVVAQMLRERQAAR